MSLCKLVDLCCYLPERDGLRRVQGVGSESRVYVWFITRATWDGYFFLWYVVDTTTICCWFKVAIRNLLNFPAGYFDIFFCAAKQLKLTNVGGSLKVWLREWRGEIWWCGSQGNGGEAPGNHHCHELLIATVDGRKPAPADMYETLNIMGYLPYRLVQDFFHQQYFMCFYLSERKLQQDIHLRCWMVIKLRKEFNLESQSQHKSQILPLPHIAAYIIYTYCNYISICIHTYTHIYNDMSAHQNLRRWRTVTTGHWCLMLPSTSQEE